MNPRNGKSGGEMGSWGAAVSCPEGAATYQPRATPWGGVDHPKPSPERATQTGPGPTLVPPFQGCPVVGAPVPGAMPRADVLRPLRGVRNGTRTPASQPLLSPLRG